MRVLLFGASGLLGKELMKINPDIICPKHKDVNICNYKFLRCYISAAQPEIIINAAAVTDNRAIEKDAREAIKTNIVGTANLSMICTEFNIRLIYISTDYVYPGHRRDHEENERIMPENLYAWTKLGGECSVKSVPDHLIIRTSFGASAFPYPTAYANQNTSKDYVDVIAPMIYKAALSEVAGVLNIGTNRKSMYDYANQRNPNVKRDWAISAKDHSLDTTKYKNYFNDQT